METTKEYNIRQIVQMVILSKAQWPTLESAQEFALSNEIKIDRVEEGDGEFRLIQRDVTDFIEGSFQTVEILEGYRSVIGKLTPEAQTQDTDIFISHPVCDPTEEDCPGEMSGHEEDDKDMSEHDEFTDKPWDGSKSRFTLDQLMASVPRAVLKMAENLARDNDREIIKSDLKLPFREPDGVVNVNGLRAVLAVLGGARGGVNLPGDVRARAQEEVSTLLDEFNERQDDMDKKTVDNVIVNFESLKNVEIFRVGVWNGDVYTKADLQDIVNNFNLLRSRHRPMLKLGHNDEQSVLKDGGLPNAGLVTNVFLKGDVLFADFDNIPDPIFALIKNKNLNDISVEIHWNLKDENTGEIFNRVLSAVALLGEEHPAVWDNSPLEMFLPENLKAASDKDINKTLRVYKWTQEELKENEMKKLEEEKKNHEDEMKTLQSENDKLKSNIVKMETDRLEKEVETTLTNFLKSGKIVPAQKENLKEIMLELGQSKKEYSLGDTKISGLKLIGKVFELAEPLVSLDESSRKTDTKPLDNLQAAKSYAKENNVSFEAALRVVGKR